MDASTLRATVQQHFNDGGRPRQTVAQQTALSVVEENSSGISSKALQAWLNQAWPEGGLHGGTTDKYEASKALSAFVKAASTQSQPPGLGRARLGLDAQLLKHQPDKTSWTESIDKTFVPARVEAFTGELSWMASLDLSTEDGQREAGVFCGWNNPLDVGPADFSQNRTTRGWLAAKLASRHHLPTSMVKEAFEDIAELAPKERPAAFRSLMKAWEPKVKEGAQRMAVYEAFMTNGRDLAKSIHYGEKDIDAARAEFEAQLGLPEGTVDTQVFDELIHGLRSGHYDGDIDRMKSLGYAEYTYNKYVRLSPER